MDALIFWLKWKFLRINWWIATSKLNTFIYCIQLIYKLLYSMKMSSLYFIAWINFCHQLIFIKINENGSHYGTTIQFCSNLPHKYKTLISIIKLASKYSSVLNCRGGQISRGWVFQKSNALILLLKLLCFLWEKTFESE